MIAIAGALAVLSDQALRNQRERKPGEQSGENTAAKMPHLFEHAANRRLGVHAHSVEKRDAVVFRIAQEKR